MKLEFKTTIRHIIRDKNILILQCGQPNEDDDFEIKMRMDAMTYHDFMLENLWVKEKLKIKIELEQVK